MCKDNSSKQFYSSWARTQTVTSVIANIAVILGIVFAGLQLTQTRSAEKRRIAIDATAPLRSSRFLEAYSKVIDAARKGEGNIRNYMSTLDDFYYVVSVCDNIALMYLSSLAEKELIKNEIIGPLKILMPIMKSTGWPPDEERKNIDALAKALQVINLQ